MNGPRKHSQPDGDDRSSTLRGRLARWTTLAILLFGCAPTDPGSTTHRTPEAGSLAQQDAAQAEPLPSSVAPSLAGAPARTTSAPTLPDVSATSTSAPQPSGRKQRYAVAAMGDSLTDPKSHGGIYLEVLREHCPKSTFESFGKGGNMTNMMRKRFLKDVYKETADDAATKPAPPNQRSSFTHVLILGGLGDILSNETAGRTAEKIAKDIGLMVDWSRARGAKAIVLTLPPWGRMKDYDAVRGQMTLDVNKWIVQAAKEGRIDGYFDVRPWLVCDGDEVNLCKKYAFKDGIHWSEAGQRSVGEALHQAMFADCE